MAADNEYLRATIQNPNTSGQGFCADHQDPTSPHAIIVAFGYTYSHSTPVNCAGWLRIEHTYEQGEHRVSWCRHSPQNPHQWRTTTSTASGRHVRGQDYAALRRHLQGKRRRYAELRERLTP
jgi:hypothetical protein